MKERPWRAGGAGALIAALITLPGLGVGTLWDNSETAYGEIAREILLRGDFVVLHFNGAPWFVQPPLYFWIAAAFAHLFGVGSLALRLPSALATIAMGAITAYAVSRQIGERAGIYASLILSTSLMQVILGRIAIMDALLDLAVVLAIYSWFRSLQTGLGRYAIYGWIAVAFGFLAKGPVAPVLAVLIIVPFAFWNRRTAATHVAWRGWILGFVAFLLIVAPWFVALTLRTGVPAVAQLIGHYSFGRYTAVIENQAGPIWYYLPVIILGFFPWIAFLPAAIVHGIERLRATTEDENTAQLLRLAFVWAVLPLIFFSFARTKLPNYMALEFPGLALIAAIYFDAMIRIGAKRSAVVGSLAVPAFVGALALAVILFAQNNRLNVDISVVSPELIAMGGALFAGSLLAAVQLARRTWMSYAPYAIGASMLVAVDVMALFVLPAAERYKPVPQLAAIIQRDRRPTDAVAIENIAGGNALIFYTQPGVYALASPGTHVEGTVAEQIIICGAPRAWVIAPAKPQPNDTTYGRDRLLVARSGKAELLLYSGRACTLRAASRHRQARGKV